jgi:hypothetical protein
VSAEGMVLTNHHCVAAACRTFHTAKDFIKEGFFTAAREEESNAGMRPRFWPPSAM